jgi:hypothetical protein
MPAAYRSTYAPADMSDSSRHEDDRPGDPCHLVGESDRDQTGWFSLQQLICPDVDGSLLVPRTPNDGSGSNDKEMPQIAVPHFRYAHSLLAAGRVLLWHQPEPSGKLPAGTEHFRVAHGGGQRGRGDEADAGDRLKSLAGRVRSMPSHQPILKLGFAFRNPCYRPKNSLFLKIFPC